MPVISHVVQLLQQQHLCPQAQCPTSFMHLCLQDQGLHTHLKCRLSMCLGDMQVQGQVQGPRTSIATGFKELLANGGVKALFKGLSLNYIKVVPATAIGFTVYDGMKVYLNINNHV